MLHRLSEDCPGVRDEITSSKHVHYRRGALNAEDGRRMIEIGTHGNTCRVVGIPRLVASGANHYGGIRQVVASLARLRPFGVHGSMVARSRARRPLQRIYPVEAFVEHHRSELKKITGKIERRQLWC